MKCHVCHKKLVLSDNRNFQVYLECPDGHAFVTIKKNDIIEYRLVWDVDETASERYWIQSEEQQTKIINSVYGSQYGKIKSIKNVKENSVILTMQQFLPIKIKDDVICLDNIIPRLKKLIAFI